MQTIDDHRDVHMIMDGLFALPVELFDVQVLLQPFEKQLNGPVRLYNSAISSALKSNRFVNKCSSFPFVSNTLMRRKTFSARFFVVPIRIILSDNIIES